MNKANLSLGMLALSVASRSRSTTRMVSCVISSYDCALQARPAVNLTMPAEFSRGL
jgi:hypothetical protein